MTGKAVYFSSSVTQLEFIERRVFRNILEDHLYRCITTKFLQRATDDVTYETGTFIQLHQCHCIGDLRFKPFVIDTVIDSERVDLALPGRGFPFPL